MSPKCHITWIEVELNKYQGKANGATFTLSFGLVILINSLFDFCFPETFHQK